MNTANERHIVHVINASNESFPHALTVDLVEQV